MIQEHRTIPAREAGRSPRSEGREWARKQARVQRELAAVQRRWARSLSPRTSGRAAAARDEARLGAE